MKRCNLSSRENKQYLSGEKIFEVGQLILQIQKAKINTVPNFRFEISHQFIMTCRGFVRQGEGQRCKLRRLTCQRNYVFKFKNKRWRFVLKKNSLASASIRLIVITKQQENFSMEFRERISGQLDLLTWA